MRRIVAAFASLLISPAFAREAPPAVTAVEVRGAAPAVNLATQVGRPVDAAAIRRDVKSLWALGRFDDVRVEEVRRDGGVAVVFRVTPRPNLRLREIRIEPHSFGLDPAVPPESSIDAFQAHRIALEAQRDLNARGYPNARVREELHAVGDGWADVHLTVNAGEDTRVKSVRVEVLGQAHARKQASGARAPRALRIHRILPGWRLLPAFTPQALEADEARVRSYYLMRGYFDAEVTSDVEMRGRDAYVTMTVRPDARHPAPKHLCGELLAERREAQRQGVLDYSVKLDSHGGMAVTRGPAYRVGRIDFLGNHHYSDSAVRRNFVLMEGQLFDERLLRKSIARLNRTHWFGEIESRNVLVQPDVRTGLANVTVQLAERKSGSWKLSGPVGPLSLAGPVQATIASRLPPWGRGIFELSTYAASVSLFAFPKPLLPIVNQPKGFIPVLALQRAFTPGEGWRSGFAIAPQLGWRNLGVGYGVAQTEGRLAPVLAGSAAPPLDVTVERPAGEAVMSCEAPKPRLWWMRRAAGVGMNVLGSLAVF
ncbi:MAG TPA: POTRA domain-containing protein [Bryobacteraceae bacterium]|nr:POTRA domain-containing protein [Bryobacteraceae bacterium]